MEIDILAFIADAEANPDPDPAPPVTLAASAETDDPEADSILRAVGLGHLVANPRRITASAPHPRDRPAGPIDQQLAAIEARIDRLVEAELRKHTPARKERA